MLSERDYYSSAVISSVVDHPVVLLKSYVPDLDPQSCFAKIILLGATRNKNGMH
jgi:hypothetical protein